MGADGVQRRDVDDLIVVGVGARHVVGAGERIDEVVFFRDADELIGEHDAIDRMLRLPDPPTTFCCGNDKMALRVYGILRDPALVEVVRHSSGAPQQLFVS